MAVTTENDTTSRRQNAWQVSRNSRGGCVLKVTLLPPSACLRATHRQAPGFAKEKNWRARRARPTLRYHPVSIPASSPELVLRVVNSAARKGTRYHRHSCLWGTQTRMSVPPCMGTLKSPTHFSNGIHHAHPHAHHTNTPTAATLRLGTASPSKKLRITHKHAPDCFQVPIPIQVVRL